MEVQVIARRNRRPRGPICPLSWEVRSSALPVVCALAALLAACDLGHHAVPEDGMGSGSNVAPTSSTCASGCHGEGDHTAPPRDTAGLSDTSATGVGAHAAHLAASSWRKTIECTACHQVPQQIGDSGHIDTPLPAELVFSGVGAGSVWSRDSLTCTNSYCHGSTLTNSIGGGSTSAGGETTAPIWNIVDGSQSQCQSCHGYPPPAPHPQDPDCGSCHPTMNPGQDRMVAYPELHIDGHLDVVNTAPCDSCHGNAGQSAPPKDTLGNTATTFKGVGAHAQHLTKSSSWHAPLDCTQCHKVPAGINDQGHIDSALPAEIVFDTFAVTVTGVDDLVDDVMRALGA